MLQRVTRLSIIIRAFLCTYARLRLCALYTLLLAIITHPAYSQIVVSADQTAAALAQKLAGQGVTISNPTLHCAGRANGLFTVTGSVPGIDSGVLLTNGAAASLGSTYGVNGYAYSLASNNNGMPGDAMLNMLAGQNTLDACSLEFDVVPHSDTIRFNYVFSSEEYNNAVCGPYNDAFAFFISGPGIIGTANMALVPGTNIPVTINSINNGIPGSTGTIANCTSMGAGSPFTAYYIDNSAGSILTHKGYTTVLQAIHSVVPCGAYHLKMVIADAGNATYDSGVFLEAGSLQSGDLRVEALRSVPADTFAFCVKNCLPGRFRIRRTRPLAQPQTVRFIKGGTAISGTDFAPFPDSVVIPPYNVQVDVPVYGKATPLYGNKTLQLFIMSQYSCSGISNIVDSASIVILDTFHIAITTPAQVRCANDSIGITVSGSDLLNYSWLPAGGLSNQYTKEPIAFPSVTTVYTLSATLPGGNCPAKNAEVRFDIKLSPQLVPLPDTAICYNTPLNLDAVTTLPNDHYSYYWSGPHGFSSTLPGIAIANTAATDSGSYILVVTIDTNGCHAASVTDVHITAPAPPTVASPQVFCLNAMPDTLLATGIHIRWYTTSADTGYTTGIRPATDAVTAYSYFVTQTIGQCESPKKTGRHNSKEML